jgi:putative ABC transport system permease protein
MNPSIVSSKRFVVNGRDFAALRSVIGETEYSIEFRLTDEDRLSEFAAAYSEAELPNTGPTVDIALLMLLNALTDGITAAIVLLVGLLSVGIAFLCLRFAVLSALAEDYREIGAMKAIGIRQQDIRDIYLAKYVALAAGGCFFGYVLSLPVSRVFTANIALYIGEGNNGAWQHLLPILAVGLLFLITLLFCSLIFRKARQVSTVEALRTGSAGEAKNGFRRLRVSKSRLPINLHLGLKDLCGRPRTYMLLLFIFIAASFLIIVPLNLLTTLNSPAFVTYMGVGECDMRLDMQQSEDVSERFGEVRAVLARDADIGRFSSFVTCRYGVIGADGAAEGIYVETGDYSVFPLAYSKGRAPISPADIALSALNARDLAKSVGDTVTLIVGGKQLSLTVCGIYQDITNGGRTAKAMLPYEPGNALWYTINADVNGGVSIRDKTAEYSARWSGVKVARMTEYLAQTLGSTIGQVERIVALTLTLATSVTILITAMFLKMLTVRDTSDIRVMKGLGFTVGNIRKQYLTRMLATLFTGVIVGTFAANTLGQSLVGVFMSGMGVSEMRFIIRPLLAYIACPFALAGVVTLTTFAGTISVGKQNPAGAITE